MKLISWNVNGLRACMTKGFMDYFDSQDADFFCLQEIKLSDGQIDWKKEGYYDYWNYAEKKGYSGTAIFTKHKPISVSYGIGIEEHDHEGRVITLEYEDYYVITVYTPNSKNELLRLDYRMVWEDAFRDYLNALKAKKYVIVCGDMNEAHPSYKSKPIIICGDLNVAATVLDIKNPKSNENNAGFTIQEREKFQQLLDSGFTDSFRSLHPDEEKYSWWSYRFKAREKNVGWRLDYFLVSDDAKGLIAEADIHTDVMGSDHAPILLQVDI